MIHHHLIKSIMSIVDQIIELKKKDLEEFKCKNIEKRAYIARSTFGLHRVIKSSGIIPEFKRKSPTMKLDHAKASVICDFLYPQRTRIIIHV